MAIHLSSKDLGELFGVFLIVAAVLLWRKPESRNSPGEPAR